MQFARNPAPNPAFPENSNRRQPTFSIPDQELEPFFTVDWIIAVALGSVASGITRVLAVNAINALATGQYATTGELLSAFVRAFADIPSVAAFTAVGILVSLIIAKMLASRYPQRRYFAYAVGGATPPFLFGVMMGLIYPFGFVDELGMAIGAVALLSGARLVREPDVSANRGQT